MIKYASVCSGVEAPSLAWEGLGWEPQWFSEIEAFPSEVLKQRFPNTPNLGDMTKLTEKDVFRERQIDLLVGGTPCQSFSVAGLQRGLDDPRGNLALEFVRLLYIKRPTWFVWENVPGVLSSNGGRDFSSILGAFAKIGYHCSWRVLDSQFFGVPQRRRRVFVVGHIGDWRSAAAVLLEPESLSGDSKQSKKKRKDFADSVGESSCFDMRGFGDYGEGCTSSTLKARDYIVSHPFAYSKSHRANGNVDVRFTEDGKANTLSCGEGCGNQSSLNIVASYPIQYGEQAGGKSQNGSGVGDDGEPSYTLTRTDVHGVCQVFAQNSRDEVRYTNNNKVGALCANAGMKQQSYLHDKAIIRRLTPLECERLQGFPDNWTNIQWKGKDAPASLRYKACGNSMAVPVMRWIGQRINFVHSFNNAQNYL
jgi:DNA (cytosine-5)-methyltransferase 1